LQLNNAPLSGSVLFGESASLGIGIGIGIGIEFDCDPDTDPDPESYVTIFMNICT